MTGEKRVPESSQIHQWLTKTNLKNLKPYKFWFWKSVEVENVIYSKDLLYKSAIFHHIKDILLAKHVGQNYNVTEEMFYCRFMSRNEMKGTFYKNKIFYEINWGYFVIIISEVIELIFLYQFLIILSFKTMMINIMGTSLICKVS